MKLEAVLPYIKSMQVRVSLDKKRFSQVRKLLYLVTDSSNSSTAGTLLEIDEIVREIKSEGGWFKSELATNLEVSVNKQWQPILSDTKRALQDSGSKLAVIGLIQMIGRPMIMLYPIWLIVQEIIMITKSIETEGRAQVIIDQ